MDTQKLVLIVIFTNILIGIGFTAINDFGTQSNAYDYNRQIQDIEQEFFTESMQEEVEPSTDYQYDKSVGNNIKIGTLITTSLFNGLVPLSIHQDMFNTPLEKILAFGLDMIRGILGILLVMETIMFWKNRKTS